MEDRRVLLFDDSQEVRGFLMLVLKRAGWTAQEYDCAHDFFHETCRNCETHDCEATVLLVDVKMPLMEGTEFVRRLKDRQCSVKKVALLSGAWTQESLDMAAGLGVKVCDKGDLFHELPRWLEEVE